MGARCITTCPIRFSDLLPSLGLFHVPTRICTNRNSPLQHLYITTLLASHEWLLRLSRVLPSIFWTQKLWIHFSFLFDHGSARSSFIVHLICSWYLIDIIAGPVETRGQRRGYLLPTPQILSELRTKYFPQKDLRLMIAPLCFQTFCRIYLIDEPSRQASLQYVLLYNYLSFLCWYYI